MILLDTNVISEPLRTVSNPAVLAWLDAQPAESLLLSTVTLAKLHYGIAVLPDGAKKQSLKQAFATRILPLFSGRILALDEAAATAYGELRTNARRQGLAIATADGYIAAIALSQQMSVATRDTTPFVAAGVLVIDPWAG